jgi:hypothetical protein
MITSYTTTRSGNTTLVTVTSSLSGTVYYHWYADVYLGFTTTPSRTFVVMPIDQIRINCYDTNDPNFDPYSVSEATVSAKRLVAWVRSLAADVALYRVEQSSNGGPWTAIGFVADSPSTWLYTLLSPRLNDLTSYAWRVVPIDEAGNDGTPTGTIPSEYIVRGVDAPKFSFSFNAGTTHVTFTMS